MHDLIELKKLHPKIVLEILYATKNNFTGKVVYPSARCFLREKTAERLVKVQRRLEKRGLGLKIWDGYRPLSVQKIFWEICPNPKFVADPAIGSRHNRGAAVDLTLVDREGRELEMPTGFDDFSERADRSYRGKGRKNRELLEEAMGAEGFLMYQEEWWHFDDPEWEGYEILDVSFDELARG
ncbi:MAG TPA: M15 family metallopeptidase [Chlamydiales bacterium]|nr:M15 family metallopeptidase [Chlamydiales bacterium]